MKNNLLSGEHLPFCPGCGHGPSVKNLSKAFQECGYEPLDIVLVSDIGCSGLVDPLFNTHTIHGLHGRSPALAMGIAMGLKNREKKVVAVQGDGGATIGLQHLLEASRRNLNMTLVLLNNQIYGMTGGQVSGLSTNEFKYDKTIPDTTPPFDVCALAHNAGAAYVCRVNNPKNVVAVLVEALQTPGFSLVEVSSLCQPYGAKKIDQLLEWAREEVVLKNKAKLPEIKAIDKPSLIEMETILTSKFSANIEGRVGVLIAGSAGGGVQSAAKLLAHAGILSGLSTTMKGEYPITVGTGFSVAEVILSNDEINYTGLEHPDVVIIVSDDGLKKIKPRIQHDCELYLDNKIEDVSEEGAHYGNFVTRSGKKGAALSAIVHWLHDSGLLSIEALRSAASNHKYTDSLIEVIDSSLETTA